MVEPKQHSVGNVVSISLLLPDNFHVPILGWVDKVNLKKKQLISKRIQTQNHRASIHASALPNAILICDWLFAP